MKLTVGQWYTIGLNLNPLIQKDLPVKIAFRLSRLIKQLEPIVAAANEKRTELVKKYGVEDASKDTVSVTKDNLPQFQKDWDELCSVVEDISFQPLRIEDLGQIQVSPQILFALDPLFEQDAAKPKEEPKKAD